MAALRVSPGSRSLSEPPKTDEIIMKSQSLALPLLAVLTAFTAPVVRAADESAPPPPPAEGRGPGSRMNAAEQLKRLTEQLDLTADQQAKIKPVLEDRDAKAKALMNDTSLSQDEKRAKNRELMKSTHDQVRALLTADQQQKYDAMRPGPGGGHKKAD